MVFNRNKPFGTGRTALSEASMTQTIYASICGALIVVIGMVVRRAVIVLTVPSKMEEIHE